MATKTATIVYDHMPHYHGYTALYRLSEPMLSADGTTSFEHVLVTADDIPPAGPITHMLGATSLGSILSYDELPGTLPGYLDQEGHAEAFQRLGYEIVSDLAA